LGAKSTYSGEKEGEKKKGREGEARTGQDGTELEGRRGGLRKKRDEKLYRRTQCKRELWRGCVCVCCCSAKLEIDLLR
jgi:hypothetical protein